MNYSDLIDKESTKFRHLHLLKGQLIVNPETDKRYIFLNDPQIALLVLCFIAFQCCEDYNKDEVPVLIYFEPRDEDNIEPMENDKANYITDKTISNDRLQIAPSDLWYYINNKGSPRKFKKLINSIKNCGNNEICDELYKIKL